MPVTGSSRRGNPNLTRLPTRMCVPVALLTGERMTEAEEKREGETEYGLNPYESASRREFTSVIGP